MPDFDLMMAPMREELTKNGLEEMRSPEDVDDALGEREGTVLVAVNSACGCAGASMRPAVVRALEHEHAPDRATTVFATQDREATARLREAYLSDFPPSSPAVALIKDGAPVFMLLREDIERREPSDVEADIVRAFDEHCAG